MSKVVSYDSRIAKDKKLRRQGLILSLLFFLSSFYFYQGGFSNPNTRYDLSLALAFDHSPEIDSFHFNTIDKTFMNGHYYAEKAPGLSYLAFPFAFVTSIFFSKNELLQNERIADFSLYFATIFTVGLICAISILYFIKLGLLLNPTLNRQSLIISTFLTYGMTMMFPYSTVMFSHGASAALGVIGLFYSVRAIQSNYWLHAVWAVSILGLMVFVEYPTVLIAGPILLWMLIYSKKKSIILYSYLAGLIPLICLLLHNYFSFGNCFTLGYGHLEDSPFAQEMAKGFFGITFPKINTLIQLLFGLYRGLIVYNPVLILAIVGLTEWKKTSKRQNLTDSKALLKTRVNASQGLILVILISTLSLLLLNSSYSYWQGGISFGPRHLLPAVPLLMTGLFFIKPEVVQFPWVISIILCSGAINLCATITNLFVSERELNPLINVYPFYLVQNKISLNPLGFITPFTQQGKRWMHPGLFSNAGAFNLGQLLGLDGIASLFPLIFIWGIGVYFIFRIEKAQK